MFVPTSGSNPS